MEIKFNEVTHVYPGPKRNTGVYAIKDVNLEIPAKDEFISVVGHTGSGKTTLIQHINALLLPTSGSIEVFDAKLTKNKRKNPPLKNIRKRIGFVFQFPEYQLFSDTVRKDILFAPKIFNIPEEESRKNLDKIAKLLKIENILDKSPFNLSGGQMRRVAIAGILVYDPDILVLDEPTRGLDPLGAKEIMDLFSYISTTMHKTIILISHDMDLVYEHSTRIIVMSDAKKVYDGDKKALFSGEKYKEYSLIKPQILETIDYLNKNLDYNLSYDISNISELISSLREKEVKSNAW